MASRFNPKEYWSDKLLKKRDKQIIGMYMDGVSIIEIRQHFKIRMSVVRSILSNEITANPTPTPNHFFDFDSIVPAQPFRYYSLDELNEFRKHENLISYSNQKNKNKTKPAPSKRNLEIFSCYIDGKSMSEIGIIFNISRQRVHQIILNTKG